jgi:hypothetical protein
MAGRAWMVVAPAGLVLGCALPDDFVKVEQSGAGGGQADCRPFEAPPTCDAAFLADADNCCVAGRSCFGGECVDGVCQPHALASSSTTLGETIDVVLMDGWAVYSTGYGSQLLRVPLTGGAPELLYTDPDFSFVTQMTRDDARVYFNDFGSGRVHSVDPESRESALVADAGRPAWFGGLAVAGERLFFTTRATDDNGTPVDPWAWYAPKDGSDTTPIGLTIQAGSQPAGVTVDDTYLYFTDESLFAVYRVPLADLSAAPEAFAEGEDPPGEIETDATYVYWIAGSRLRAAPRAGGAPVTLGSTAAYGVDLTIDATHAYWTTEDGVFRAPLDGGRTDQLAAVPHAKGIAVDCDHIAITTYASGDDNYVYLIAK